MSISQDKAIVPAEKKTPLPMELSPYSIDDVCGDLITGTINLVGLTWMSLAAPKFSILCALLDVLPKIVPKIKLEMTTDLVCLIHQFTYGYVWVFECYDDTSNDRWVLRIPEYFMRYAIKTRHPTLNTAAYPFDSQLRPGEVFETLFAIGSNVTMNFLGRVEELELVCTKQPIVKMHGSSSVNNKLMLFPGYVDDITHVFEQNVDYWLGSGACIPRLSWFDPISPHGLSSPLMHTVVLEYLYVKVDETTEMYVGPINTYSRKHLNMLAKWIDEYEIDFKLHQGVDRSVVRDEEKEPVVVKFSHAVAVSSDVSARAIDRQTNRTGKRFDFDEMILLREKYIRNGDIDPWYILEDFDQYLLSDELMC
jgi:hypothetical protein